MIRKLTNDERSRIDNEAFKDELLPDEMFLYSSLEYYIDSNNRYERNAYSHSNDLKLLKDLYQNVVLFKAIESINYNKSINTDGLDLYSLIELKRDDFKFNDDEKKIFNEFLNVIKTEPNSFLELKEYVAKTGKLLEALGLWIEVALYGDYFEAFDRMLIDYDGDIPGYVNHIDFIKENTCLNSITKLNTPVEIKK